MILKRNEVIIILQVGYGSGPEVFIDMLLHGAL
jgi:hypothetical protein